MILTRRRAAAQPDMGAGRRFAQLLCCGCNRLDAAPAHSRRGHPPPRAGQRTQGQRQDVPAMAARHRHRAGIESVSVRAAVDGTLMQVPVTEGQTVKQGDAARGDRSAALPGVARPALAKKAQDEAQLAQRQSRPGALLVAGPAGFCLAAAARHAADAGQPVDRRARNAMTRRSRRRSSTSASATSRRRSMGALGCDMIDPGNFVHATEVAASCRCRSCSRSR